MVLKNTARLFGLPTNFDVTYIRANPVFETYIKLLPFKYYIKAKYHSLTNLKTSGTNEWIAITIGKQFLNLGH